MRETRNMRSRVDVGDRTVWSETESLCRNGVPKKRRYNQNVHGSMILPEFREVKL